VVALLQRWRGTVAASCGGTEVTEASWLCPAMGHWNTTRSVGRCEALHKEDAKLAVC
jgi:hypothetical protein